MPTFAYKVKDRNGRIKRGSSKAENSKALIGRLREQGLMVTEIRQQKRESGFRLPSFGKVSIEDLALFSRQFSTMMSAGVPLTEALDILSNQTENKILSAAVNEVKTEVENGGSLAVALTKHPKIFTNLYVNMVKAGEATGALETVLNELADLIEKQRDLKNKVKSAVFLPMVILGLCVLITIGLIVFVVPRFASIFEDMNAKLPGPTQVLVNISNTIRSPMGLVVLGVIIALVFIIRKVIKTKHVAPLWDQMKLKLPLFGSLLTKRSIASFARTFSLLERSGVPILESLDIVAETANNRIVSDAILKARSSIQQGENISKPLSESQVFPPMVTHMIVIGENTGNIDLMLSKIADLYEDEVDRAVESIIKLIEPLMMVVVGGLVGSILICLYLPIFNLAGAISSGIQ